MPRVRRALRTASPDWCQRDGVFSSRSLYSLRPATTRVARTSRPQYHRDDRNPQRNATGSFSHNHFVAHLELVTLIVRQYDPAIRFFVDVLQFELVEDVPALTNDGRPKRWVVVRPRGAATGILLARADGEHQRTAVGEQFAGRVGLFLRVDDFDDTYARMLAAGVEFVSPPRTEPYGTVAVFLDVEGNRWDLLSRPRRSSSSAAGDY